GSNTAPSRYPFTSANAANYWFGGASPYPIDGLMWTSAAGAYSNSPSPFGTFDQGGNVQEFNEAVIEEWNGEGYDYWRAFRGGSFQDDYGSLSTLVRYGTPSLGVDNMLATVGFRVVKAYVPPAPGITEFSPTSGPAKTVVTITGTAFTGSTAVTFNGIPAAFTVVSDTSISATVPSGNASGTISVPTPAGSDASSSSFTRTATTWYVPTDEAMIQSAIDTATAGDTIEVAAGTYDEAVHVDKQLSVLGPNAGIDPNTGVRSAEATLQSSAHQDMQFRVLADGITVDGLTFDGSLHGSAKPISNWASDDAASPTVINNLTVKNCIIQNYDQAYVYSPPLSGESYPNGVKLSNYSASVSSGHLITKNRFDNIYYTSGGVYNPARLGSAIDFYVRGDAVGTITGTVSDNVVTNVAVGVALQNINTGSVTVSGNSIQAFTMCVRNQFDAGAQPLSSTVSITNNTLTPVTSIPGYPTLQCNAIQVASDRPSASQSTVISGNTITGPRYGVRLYTYNAAKGFGSVSITGNTITGCTDTAAGVLPAGVRIDGLSTGSTVGTIAITGNTISGNSGPLSNGFGVRNQTTTQVNATGNWWGTASGPYNATTNPAGTANAVTDYVTYNPWYSTSGMTPKTYSVGAGKTYTTIQSAIDAASANDTILVAAGTYVENVDIDKVLTITGTSAVVDGDVTLDAKPTITGVAQATGHVCNVTANGTIQTGIDIAGAGNTVNIANGTYIASNTTINKSLTVQGESKAGVIIAPAANDTQNSTDYGGTYQQGLIVVANDVTIKNLTIDGDANNIANGGTLTNQHNFRTGIITISSTQAGPYNNLTVQDCVVRNLVLKGISLSNTSSGGHLIADNTIESIAIKHGIYSQAADATITRNTISKTGMGILFSTGVVTPSSKTSTITDNTLFDIAGIYSTYYNGSGWPSNGIYYRNPNVDETVIITGNHLTVGDGAEVDSPGVCAFYIYNTDANSQISNNTVDTTQGTNNLGVFLGGSAGTTVDGNTFAMNDSDTGIYLGRGVAGTPVPNVVSDNTFTSTGSTSSDSYAIGTDVYEGTGILMSNDGLVFWLPEIPYDTNTTVTGNTITGFVRGIALYEVASGAYVQPGSTVKATVHSNSITGNTEFGIDASTVSTDVDATNNWWGAASGPFNAALNPAGTGNAVSANVLFDPWSLPAGQGRLTGTITAASAPQATCVVSVYNATTHAYIKGVYTNLSGVYNLTGLPAGSYHLRFTNTTPLNLSQFYDHKATIAEATVVTLGSETKTVSADLTLVTPTPTLTSFTPASGPVGTVVTITGTNLTAASAVTFNGTAATTYSVVNATQITATVPSGATTGKVAVTTAGGTATSAADFTVIPTPTIS
ncbi:MAG: IPT/TIG domain-containing protein, partial [Actinomycetes bacterium]